jgi:hypothetical protein
MVKPKRWIARTIEEIGAGVSANGVVSASMHAQKWTGRLHACLKGGDIGVVGDEVGNEDVGGLRGGVGVDVASDAAGVIA